ncbi:inositol monophosphatase family protein [Rugamonas sp. DEMB1]|uniref:inositol monophosphatase family protein n=1 Tax=Rugamonas sp. DEMB1 TaxID=3039386 RepID=UPI00244951B8|nr:inositol monophosphatase [Rugamonas sp. DEMB1]WGG48741.1 inositol monophosphatase [Rugamonas sp. DEMB1]
MTTIDTNDVLERMRDVAADLCEVFWQQEPVIELDEMFAAFQRIDGGAGAALRASLAEAYPHIGWLDGELERAAANDDDEDDGDGDGGDAGECRGERNGGGEGEGASARRQSRGEYWICDAIDGAVMFVRAIPNWAMSLTLVRDGEAVFATVYDPLHDETFHALAGGGAFRNGKPMRVNDKGSHYHGIVASSQPPYVGKDQQAMARAGQSLSGMLRDVVAVRNFGPTSLQLAYVACGRLDAFWEFGEDGFNCIGAALLVREAGGLVTQVDGLPYGLGATASIAAAPPAVHASMLVRLRESLPETTASTTCRPHAPQPPSQELAAA